nr:neurofilament heavy polypeptide-like [Malus domestica]
MSVENAASPPRKPVTQEESRIIGKLMEDEEARKQYPKRYVGEPLSAVSRLAYKRKSKAGTSSGSPPKSKSPRQTKKARVEEEVATSVEKATSPPKSKKTRQTKKVRVEEEVATSVEKFTSPLKSKSPRLTRSARVEEEVATSVEKAASPPKTKNTRQTRKARVEEEVASSVEKAASPLKSKKTRQTKEGGVEEEVAMSVEKFAYSPKSKNPRETKNARVEEEVAMSGKICFSSEVEESEKTRVEEGVATSMEKAASPLRKPVTQELAAADEDGEESRFIGKPMEDKEAHNQYPKRYVGEVIKHCATVVCGRVFFSDVRDDNPLDCLVDQDVKSKSIRHQVFATIFYFCQSANRRYAVWKLSHNQLSVENDVCLDSEVDSKLSNGVGQLKPASQSADGAQPAATDVM